MTSQEPSTGRFLLRWAVYALAVLVATQVVPGIEYRGWEGLVAATLLLGLLNVFVRPLLLLLSLPLVVFTLGLFLWVINAALLYFVGWLVAPFDVTSFGSALGGAAVISIVATLLGSAVGVNTPAIRARRPRPGGVAASPSSHDRRPPPGNDGGGPVIDV